MTDGTEIPTLTDIEDSKKAMDDIQAFTYNTVDSFIDAKGITRDTVTGRIKKMGYAVPVTYTVGIVFGANDNVKTVGEDGIVYAPLPSALPFTTSGTFIGDDDARFFVVQGVTNDQVTNDLSQSYTFKSKELMVASLIVFPDDKRLVWQGYDKQSDGGSNWGVVKSGAHTEDGGEIFTLADGKFVQANTVPKKSNANKWGAGLSSFEQEHDDTVQLNRILATPKSLYMPAGNYYTSGELLSLFNNRLISGDGVDTIILPDLTAGQTALKFNVQPVRSNVIGISFGLPTGGEPNITCIEYANAVFQNRGTSIRDINIEGIWNGIKTKEIFSKFSIRDFAHHVLDAAATGNVSIDIAGATGQGNTTFLRDLDIIGKFAFGVKLKGRVNSIRDSNIAGSGTFTMDKAILADNCPNLKLDTVWVEQLTNPGNPGDAEAVKLINCNNATVDNVNFANGSLYLDSGKDITIKGCPFSNTTGGIRPTNNPAYTIENAEQTIQSGDDSAFYGDFSEGIVTVIGSGGQEKPKFPIFSDPFLDTLTLGVTNNSVVTANTVDFLSGARCLDFTVTAGFSGMRANFSGLIVGQLYTYVCYVKKQEPNFNLTLVVAAGIGTRNANNPQVTLNREDEIWHKMIIPFVPNGSGDIRIEILLGGAGSFLLDSQQIWLGYRIDAPSN